MSRYFEEMLAGAATCQVIYITAICHGSTSHQGDVGQSCDLPGDPPHVTSKSCYHLNFRLGGSVLLVVAVGRLACLSCWSLLLVAASGR